MCSAAVEEGIIGLTIHVFLYHYAALDKPFGVHSTASQREYVFRFITIASMASMASMML